MSKFDAAIDALHGWMTEYPERQDEVWPAVRVLEAAAKVDAKSWRAFIAWYGTQHNVYPPGYYELYRAITGEAILDDKESQ